ncbi:RDD family protein [Kordia sp. SMS9]|uniref:RDD family protein n=1 Tax=Kordia sp. SMS9 TaxID=2282170 RepID=UPI000E0D559E|nr:RDD family protein [Kordia sp. SMS9]AXG71183.1 RDD family protein [Kordia sp. SMS9]
MNFQKVKDFIYKNSAYIALYFSGINILSYFLDFFYKYSLYDGVIQTFRLINFGGVSFSFFRSDFLTITVQFGSSYIRKPAFEIFFALLFFIGAIIYIKSKKKENRMLDFAFSLLFFTRIVALITLPFMMGNALTVNPWTISVIVFKLSLVIFISYIYLQRSFQEKQLVPLEDDFGLKVYLNDNRFAETLRHVRVSKWKRLAHYLVDILLIIGIFSKFIFILPRSFTTMLSETFGDRFSVYILFFIASSIYYLFFESIFKTTPGKCLTNSRIINYKKGNITFNQFIWRTFSRRIPFEAFSFFGSIGWHDLISTTTVVQQTAEKKYDRFIHRILIVFGLMILLTAFVNIFSIF